MLRLITSELRHHAPFTAFGAITGIVFVGIIVFSGILSKISEVSYAIFYVLHPAHVVLSAMVTTALYKKHAGGKLWAAVLVGYFGSVGIATLSDSIIPYLGEILMVLPHREAHIGFIEEWWIVNPAALLGIGIGYLRQTTRFPHYGHVMISTWASLFHIVMALGGTVNWITFLVIFVFLFLAVWVPCCLSDIIFPLLFVKDGLPHQHI